MYIETTGQTAGDRARVASPSFTPPATGGEACARFHYHMYGETIGRLNVYVRDDQSSLTNPIWTRAAQKGNEWVPAQIPINPLGQKYQVSEVANVL